MNNISLEQLVGIRPVEQQPANQPVESGYHCPVCIYLAIDKNGKYDERLQWSQFNGFLWCSVCKKNYPTVLCTPDVEKAIKVYISCIEDAKKRI